MLECPGTNVEHLHDLSGGCTNEDMHKLRQLLGSEELPRC